MAQKCAKCNFNGIKIATFYQKLSSGWGFALKPPYFSAAKGLAPHIPIRYIFDLH